MIKSLSVGAFPEINDSFYSCVFFLLISLFYWSSSFSSLIFLFILVFLFFISFFL